MPVRLRRGTNRIEASIAMIGLKIPDLDHFSVSRRVMAGDIAVELRPAGRDGRAILKHPCIPFWIGARVSVEVRNRAPGQGEPGSGASRGEELFRDALPWSRDATPETQFRYRALLPDPDILFLDEPVSVLDPLGIKQVHDLSSGRLMVEDGTKSLLSRIAGEREIAIGLENPPAGLTDDLRGLAFICGASWQEELLVLKVAKGGDHRRALSEWPIRRDLVPLSIEERVPSLEEAFVTITQESIAALAPGGRE